MKCIHFAALAAVALAGCLSVKTEHEVKPIEINMNINLKLDKQLEEMMANEEKPSIRALMDKGAVGIDNKSLLVPKAELTSAEMEHLFEVNSKRKEHLAKMAEENGKTYDEVAAAAAAKMVERIPDGKGVWYQKADGTWTRK